MDFKLMRKKEFYNECSLFQSLYNFDIFFLYIKFQTDIHVHKSLKIKIAMFLKNDFK